MAAKKSPRRAVRKKRATKPVVEKKRPVKTKLLRELLRAFGEDVIRTDEDTKVEIIPTTIAGINWVMARGGLPRGRVVEISGRESHGKSTVCYFFIREVQKIGGRTALIDTENSIDMEYLRACGVDTSIDKLLIAQPDFSEQAFMILERLIESEEYDLIVIDSLAGMVPKAELEGEMTDQQMALQARINAKSSRRLNTLLRGSKTCLVYTNQLRDKIGGFGGFGPQTDTTGGRALKHAMHIRLFVQRTKPIKVGSKQTGFMMRFKCVKNKLGQPNRMLEIPITFGYGLDERLDLILMAQKAKIIRKKASMYYLKKRLLGNGWYKAYKTIARSPRLLDQIQGRIDRLLTKNSDLLEEKSEDDT